MVCVSRLVELGPQVCAQSFLGKPSSAAQDRVAALVETMEQEGVASCCDLDHETAALLLLTFLRKLSEPPIPAPMRPAFVAAAALPDRDISQLPTLRGLLLTLPAANRLALQELLHLLNSWCDELSKYDKTHDSTCLDDLVDCCVPLLLGAKDQSEDEDDDDSDDTSCLCTMIGFQEQLFQQPKAAPEQATPPTISMRDRSRSEGAIAHRHRRALSMSVNTHEADTKFKHVHVVPLKNKNVKRKKFKVKKGKTVVKGTVSYDLMLALKIGIFTAVSVCHEQRRNTIDLSDFALRNSEFFPADGSVSKPRHNSRDFIFKDYCPHVFRQLREFYGCDTDEYIESICDEDSPLRQLGSPGRSGAVFYFSNDMKYLIKSVSKKESKFLRRMIPYFYEHVMTHRDTLISLFYQLMTVMPVGMPIIGLVVMPNLLDAVVHEVYDLKGSTHGRFTKDKDKEKGIQNVVQKDLDVTFKLYIQSNNCTLLNEQLHKDARFLESMRIMDYSILLGIQRLAPELYMLSSEGWPILNSGYDSIEEEEEEENKSANAFQQDAGGIVALRVEQDESGELKSVVPVIAYISIIDILQTFDNFKFSEHWVKRLWIQRDAISVNDPSVYANRFLQSITSLFCPCDEPPSINVPDDLLPPLIESKPSKMERGRDSQEAGDDKDSVTVNVSEAAPGIGPEEGRVTSLAV